MNFIDYIPLATRTCKELPFPDHINHMGLGIVGEMGEIVDQLKKAYIYGKAVDQVNIVEEVGDVAWYVAGIYHHYPEAQGFIDSAQLRNDVDPVRLEAAKKVLTRTILLNTMSMANLVVDLGIMADQGASREDQVKVVLVIGQALYATARLLDVDLHQAFEVNIAKLAKRFGEKFSDYAALNRDLDAERAVLEAGVQGGAAA